MIYKIAEALNAGYPNVKAVVYGDYTTLPPPPYCVVKDESSAVENRAAFRIIAHFKPGQGSFMRDYIRGTVGSILDNFGATNRHGNYNRLWFDNDINWSIEPESDDGTISMSRVYWMPDIL